MNFASDNAYGAAPEILAALAAANEGAVASYGDDPFTAQLKTRMAALFGRDVAVFPVITGTAANVLALSTLCPQHGAILCHATAHVVADECGGTEFYTHGARLVPIPGEHGKLTPLAIERALRQFRKGDAHSLQPAVISLTQATEAGTVYAPKEIVDIASLAKAHGLKLHIDGARFANALAHLECSPAEATWGVDALSFGATKNGALGAEAVIFFDPADARDFEYRRMKGGHLLSKMRFVSAQLLAYIEDGRWLAWAARSNGLAKRLAQGLAAVPDAEIVHPVDANAVFVRLPDETIRRFRARGVRFYDWGTSENGRTLARFVTSFMTSDADLERFLDLARG